MLRSRPEIHPVHRLPISTILRRSVASTFIGIALALLGALALPAASSAAARRALSSVARRAPFSSAARRAPNPRTIWTIGGNGTGCAAAPLCGDGGPASGAQISFPQGVAVDGAGNVYVADWGDNEIRKISPSGTITVVAGDGTACDTVPNCGDGGPATSAQLSFPMA